MFSEQTIRRTIWASVPYNFVGAVTFGLPQSWPAQLVDLPAAPSIYAWNMGFLIALFGLAYAWIASQPRINRPLLALGAIGKIGVFVIAAVLTALGKVNALLVLAVVGDLILGSLWLMWLTGERTASA